MTEEKKEAATPEPKKQEAKTVKVRVQRAVDGYHVRGAELTVPNDRYHQFLLKQGSMVLVKE